MTRGVMLLAGTAFLLVDPLSAQDAADHFALGHGRALYLTHCVGCHGALGLDAKGQPVRAPGSTRDGGGAPDLTLIQSRDGTFKAVHVANHISGRQGPSGSARTMPCWASHLANEWPAGDTMGAVKIYWLTKYLESVQEADSTARR
jgi:mono/diheme cytochrome c family protein